MDPSPSSPSPTPLPPSSATSSDPATPPPDDTNATSSSVSAPSNPLSPPPPTTKLLLKRRRKRKHYPGGMISMVLRPHSSTNSTYHRFLTDRLSLPRRPRRRTSTPSDTAPDPLDVDALIAISVGFPVDSLTEEEIHANVVPILGGIHQSEYISVRNHVIAKWRSDVSSVVTRESAFESTRAELRHLVDVAYDFLSSHGYINFGLSLSIKNSRLYTNDKINVVVVGAGLAGLCGARQLRSMGFNVVVLEGRRRPGGRVRTKKMEGEGVVGAADLGGSVLTGINGNPLGVLARQLGFPLHKVRDICPLYLPNGKTVDDDVDSRVEAVFNKLLDRVCKLRQVMTEEMKCVDVSLGTALEVFRKVFSVANDAHEKMLFNWHLANLEYANASLLSSLSMAFWDQDDPYEMGGDHLFYSWWE